MTYSLTGTCRSIDRDSHIELLQSPIHSAFSQNQTRQQQLTNLPTVYTKNIAAFSMPF